MRATYKCRHCFGSRPPAEASVQWVVGQDRITTWPSITAKGNEASGPERKGAIDMQVVL